METRGKLMQ